MVEVNKLHRAARKVPKDYQQVTTARQLFPVSTIPRTIGDSTKPMRFDRPFNFAGEGETTKHLFPLRLDALPLVVNNVQIELGEQYDAFLESGREYIRKESEIYEKGSTIGFHNLDTHLENFVASLDPRISASDFAKEVVNFLDSKINLAVCIPLQFTAAAGLTAKQALVKAFTTLIARFEDTTNGWESLVLTRLLPLRSIVSEWMVMLYCSTQANIDRLQRFDNESKASLVPLMERNQNCLNELLKSPVHKVYVPNFCCTYSEARERWKADLAGFLFAITDTERFCWHELFLEEHSGTEPTHYQMYETLTVGTPLTKVCETADELVDELVHQKITLIADYVGTPAEWREVIDETIDKPIQAHWLFGF
jgi:hypothetical protein